MKAFMDQDFLLKTDTAKHLFHDVAKDLPIYRLPLPPDSRVRGFKDHRFDNLSKIWLEGDHYKWRAMRTVGVDEKYCTGDASDREKFLRLRVDHAAIDWQPALPLDPPRIAAIFRGPYSTAVPEKTADHLRQCCRAAKKRTLPAHVSLCAARMSPSYARPTTRPIRSNTTSRSARTVFDQDAPHLSAGQGVKHPCGRFCGLYRPAWQGYRRCGDTALAVLYASGLFSPP